MTHCFPLSGLGPHARWCLAEAASGLLGAPPGASPRGSLDDDDAGLAAWTMLEEIRRGDALALPTCDHAECFAAVVESAVEGSAGQAREELEALRARLRELLSGRTA